MAKKPTITTITSGFASINTLNANFSALREAFDNTLSRDGSTPNTMSVDFDMNSKNIINVNSIKDATGTDVLQSLRNTIDEFSDLYLGSKAVDPTVDNDGDPLVTGAIYFNTTTNSLKVYNGATWGTGVQSATVSGDENTVQGENSWSASVNTLLADGNTGYGYGVFANVDTASLNVAVGAFALENLTTGTANVAVGYRALENTTVGGNNVGIGRYALQNVGDSAGTGSFNIGIGEEALQNLNSGGNNIALGFQAGHDATTGDYNFFAGQYAGEHVNADDNIAIGRQALEGISGGTSTGSDNIALGNKAIQSITTGSHNIGLGFETLKDINTGFQNIAIGYQSGDKVTTGQRNIFIGHESGDEILTSSKGIIIGGFGGVNVFANRSPDMRSTDGRIVISDQDGNIRLSIKEDGKIGMGDAHFANTLLELGGDNSTVAIGEATNILRLTDTDDTVISNQIMGRIEFASQDGSLGAAGSKASIQAAATSTTPSAKLIFSTSDGPLTAPEARFVIDDNGKVLVGTDAPSVGVGSLNAFTYAPEYFQVQGTTDSTAGIVIGRSSADANGPNLTFYKTRAEESGLESSTGGADIDDNDIIGNINFKGKTNAGATIGAKISAELDGTVGTNSSPAALTFHTMEDGTTSLVERIRIAGDGKIGINTNDPTAPFHINTGSGTGNITDGLLIENTHDGSTTAPDVALYKNSVTPADNDSLGAIWFYGNNSDGDSHVFSGIYAKATDVTAASEDSELVFQTIQAGTSRSTVEITSNTTKLLGGTSTEYHSLGLIRNDAAVASGDVLGIVGFGHTDGTPDFPDQTGAQLSVSIKGVAAETMGDGDDGARLEFYTKAVNDNKNVNSTLRWTIEANGDLTSEGGDLYMSSNTIHDVTSIDNSTSDFTITTTSDSKISLSGSSNPYIRWEEGTTDKFYIQWNAALVAPLFRNQAGGNFYFRPSSTTTAVRLLFDASDGDNYGSVYATHDNHIGFLDQDGHWAYRHNNSTDHRWYVNNVHEMTLTASTLDMLNNTITNVEDIYLNDRIYHDGDTDTYIQFHAANQFRVVTGGTEMFEINDTNIQLGAALNVNNQILNNVEDIELNDRIYHDGDTNNYFQFHAADQQRHVVAGSERMEIKSSSPHVLISGDLQVTGSITGGGSGGLVNAWATMEANGTVSIRADSGFTSIVDLGVGQFYANITAQSDTNYATVYGSNTHNGTTWSAHARPVLYTQAATDRNPTTTRFYWHVIAYSAIGYRDVDYMMFHIAR